MATTGSYLGSFDEYYKFPKTGKAGDYCVLRFDDGNYKAGIYNFDSNNDCVFLSPLSGTLNFTLSQISSKLGDIDIDDLPTVSKAITDAISPINTEIVSLKATINTAKDAAIANDTKIANIENTLGDQVAALQKSVDLKADLSSVTAVSDNVVAIEQTVASNANAATTKINEVKASVDTVSQTISELNVAVSDNIAAIGTQIDAIKTAATTETDARKSADTALQDTDTAIEARVLAVEERKEVKDNKVITVLMDGNTRPFNAQASGFNNNGSGQVAGATSWNAWLAVGQDISQSGLSEDVYEISAGFGSASSFGSITFNINGVSRSYTQQGIQAGTLSMVESNDGNWRVATVTVTGNFTGNVEYVGFNGSSYIGTVVKRIRIAGFSVDGKQLALAADTPNIDLSVYALKADIPATVDLSGYLKIDDAVATYATISSLDAETTNKALASDLTALAARVQAIEDLL